MAKLQKEQMKDDNLTEDIVKDVGKLSLENQPEQENLIHPLQNSWTLWCDISSTKKKQTSENYGESLKSVYSAKSVEEFWSLVNSVKAPTEFSIDQKVNLHLFKNDIPPKWEDENNKGGGVFGIENINIGDINEIWKFTMLACISESLEDPTSDHICGCTLNVRSKKFFRVYVWVRKIDDSEIRSAIRQKLLQFLQMSSRYNVVYRPHQ